MLTSQARETLRGVETVIIDEVHAVAGTKRGAHLALSLERLDALLEQPAQRIGLSATVRPLEEVARFLGGTPPVEIVSPPSTKEWDLRVVVPVEDMTDARGVRRGVRRPRPRSTSIWPHVEEHVVDLSSSTAPRSSSPTRAGSPSGSPPGSTRSPPSAPRPVSRTPATDAQRPAEAGKPPAQVMAQSGHSSGAEAVIAKAHHGSVSKEQRAHHRGRPQARSAPLRRRDQQPRARHRHGLGRPRHPDRVAAQRRQRAPARRSRRPPGRRGEPGRAVPQAPRRPRADGRVGRADALGSHREDAVPTNPLDVLAQQVVAALAMEEWPVDELFSLMTRAASYTQLPRSAYDATLDLLSGRYPSDEFAELRPRIVWDRVTGTLTGRPGAQRLAVTSGGTIPDRGLFGVFLVAARRPAAVGELDEEMVYESRVGDIFALGATSWRIEDITHDRVLVTPAPGIPGRLPFWKGDALGRPAELGEAVGAFTRELGRRRRARPIARPRERGPRRSTPPTTSSPTSPSSARPPSVVPSDRTLVVERFRDELGDWRLVVHSPYGTPVHAPWALAINARLRERFGVDGQAVASDDGIVIRIPDTDAEPPTGEVIVFEPEEIEQLVTQEVGGSALFAARFRECAARALLLPRRDPGRRSPLWQQRQRSAQLLEVASKYPSFPIVLEAVRECLQDVYDLPALVALLAASQRREVTVVDVATTQPARSPAACSSATSPSSSTRATPPSPSAAPRRSPSTRACSPSCSAAPSSASCSTPRCWPRSRPSCSGSPPTVAPATPRASPTCCASLGPLSTEEIRARSVDGADVEGWRASLDHRRVRRVRMAGEERWAADRGRRPPARRPRRARAARHARRVPEPVEDPLGDLVSPLRPHPRPVHHRRGRRPGSASARPSPARPCSASPTAAGCSTGSSGPSGSRHRVVRRRGAAQAAPPFARPAAPGDRAGQPRRGRPLPARLAARRRGAAAARRRRRGRRHRPARRVPGPGQRAGAAGARRPRARLRARRCSTSSPPPARCIWAGHGAAARQRRLGQPPPRRPGPPDPARARRPRARRLPPGRPRRARPGRGVVLPPARRRASASTDDAALSRALWDLVWAGRVSNDTLAPLRALVRSGTPGPPHPPSAAAARPRTTGGRMPVAHRSARDGRPLGAAARAATPTRRAGPTPAPSASSSGTASSPAAPSSASASPGGFAGVYKVL